MNRRPAADYLPSHRCWLHPAVEVRDSSIEGQGLFARSALAEGTVVIRLGGTIVSNRQLVELIAAADADPALPYVDSVSIGRETNLLIAPGQAVHYGNHSCDPNVWHVDAFTLTARRDIDNGEELTVDYATQTDDEAFAMDCQCRSPLCRGQVTGRDWRLPALRERYGRHCVPALIDREESG